MNAITQRKTQAVEVKSETGVKHTARQRMQTLACAFLVALAGCSTFQVSNPKPSDPVARVNGWGRDSTTDQIFVEITFSSPVNLSTLVPGKTIYLNTAKIKTEAGIVVPISPNKVKFVSQHKFDELALPHPDDSFELRMIGTDSGDGAVKDTSGTNLDGDYNGSPGGDYSMTFTIIG